jgi:diguanylate cyclase (GGDEF)-like protein
VPIKSQQHVLGVINLESKEKDAFTQDDERLLQTIAGQLAVGIENVRLFEETIKLAITDELTGLNTRRFFFDMARKEFERSRRFDHPLAAIMLDLDHFKKVNDAFGHSSGDQVLAAVASGCKRELREVDLIGRYGGDEYSILLPETSLEKGENVAKRLCAMVSSAAVQTEHNLIDLTVSLGVASFNPDCPSVEKLLDRADMALYDAKQSGRNQVCVKE